MAWLQEKSWKILQWPSQSPDPLENLWCDLKEVVAASKNITELEAIVHEEWAKILQKHCQKLASG